MQGAVWPTYDVDVVIEPGKENLERLAAALQDLQAEYDTIHRPASCPMRASFG